MLVVLLAHLYFLRIDGVFLIFRLADPHPCFLARARNSGCDSTIVLVRYRIKDLSLGAGVGVEQGENSVLLQSAPARECVKIQRAF
jgi:hypothetical protein